MPDKRPPVATLYPDTIVGIDAVQPISTGMAASDNINDISSSYTRYPYMNIKVVVMRSFDCIAII